MMISASSALAAGERPAPPAGDWLGDWLLTFDQEASALPARQAAMAWQLERRGMASALWCGAAGPGWRGMPFRGVATPQWAAWLTGELYGTKDPAVAVAAVVDGQVAPTTLNGHFLLLAHYQATDEWHVWTNRHASLHAYLATGRGRTAVGTFVPAVAAAGGRAELDWEALTAFFGFGFFAGDRTQWQGVRILRPATHYRFDGRGQLLAETRYWEWRHAPEPSRTYDDTLAEFAALFGQVMGDLMADGRVAVPISGGLDSRTTVATMAPGDASDGRRWAYSYGYSADSVETRIAGRVAAARALPFNAFTIPPYLFGRLPDVVAALEGFVDVTQSRQAAVVDAIDRRADWLIAAHLGDLYLDDMGLAGAAPGSLGEDELTGVALKKIRKGGSDWLLTNLCVPRLAGEQPESLLRRMAADEVSRLASIVEPDFRIKAFKVDQWCARWTTVALRMFQPAVFPRLPFYDTRLADFFLTVPTEFVAGRRLQIDYLRRYAPDLAGVTWQRTGSNLWRADRPDPLATAQRAINKGWRTLIGRPVIERNWEVQFFGPDGRRGLTEWLLRPGLRLHEFVAPRAIADLLAAFQAAPLADKRGYTVSMLLTFSAWLEVYGNGSGAR